MSAIKDIKAESSRLGPACTALQAWRIKHEAATGRKPDGYWHPSSISGCPTAAVLDSLGFATRPRHDARLLRIFDTGHALHAMLQTQFSKAGIVPLLEIEGTIRPAWEVPFTVETLRLRGTIDLILEINGQKVIGELKTKNSNSFAKMVDAEEAHKIQVDCYTIGAEASGYITSRTARIIYFSKDDAHMAEIRYEVTDARIAAVKTKIDLMNGMVSEWNGSKRVFPAPYYSEPSKPPCRNCQWSAVCHATMQREAFIKEQKEAADAKSPCSTVPQGQSGQAEAAKPSRGILRPPIRRPG